MDTTTRTLVNVATHYDCTLRELRLMIAALRASDSQWAQDRADSFESVIAHMSLIGEALEGVPTWSDINDRLRAGDK